MRVAPCSVHRQLLEVYTSMYGNDEKDYIQVQTLSELRILSTTKSMAEF